MKIKLLLNNIKVFLVDHFHILFKSAAENHLRIEKCKKNIKEGASCNLAFHSFTHLKKYQRKTRWITFSFSSTAASIMIAMLVLQIFSQSSSQGATFTFLQNSWLGGSTANTAAHPTNETNWNQYQSKDAQVVAGADLKLEATAGSKTSTDDADFAGGTNTNVVIVNGEIKLDMLP